MKKIKNFILLLWAGILFIEYVIIMFYASVRELFYLLKQKYGLRTNM